MAITGSTLLGRYYLRDLIDSGGMADVYLAWDKQRLVNMAIKVLRRDLASNSKVTRLFQHEAGILRQLEHPNIVRLYEFGKDGNEAFFVMDWVDGGNLAQKIKANPTPLTIAETARVLGPVVSALAYAHRSEIYHCDVKPANIMLHVDGRVLLTDFGVARLAGDDIDGGTPIYMAPEQFDDQAVDARTDVYGLGVTLYEMLSGRQPFRGDSANSKGSTVRERIAWEHHFLPVPPLRQANPRLDGAVEQVVTKAMCKEPAQRYQSVIELMDAFNLPARGQQPQRDERTTSGTWMFQKSEVHVKEKQVIVPPERKPPPPPPAEKQPPVLNLSNKRDPHLNCRQGVLAGQAFRIPPGGLTIGRGIDCLLHLSEPSVSRKHATIERGRRGEFYLRDDGSSVGTFLNGNKINGIVVLKSGDIIKIGFHEVFEFVKT